MGRDDPALTCDGLTKAYSRGGFVLGPITLTMGAGVTCLVGPNGAGKSTFFRLAAGVDRPTRGKLDLVSSSNPSGLGYLPQEPSMPLRATCRQFLRYVAWLYKVPRHERCSAVDQALASVGLADMADRRVGSLSGGMKRRLGVAHALVHDPGLVLLDEPTAGLDPTQRIALRETVKAVSARRVVIVSTHLVEDIRSMADRVVLLTAGQIVFDGTVRELESRRDPTAPGDTDLEQAVSTLMTGTV